jgi:hypothetical protein
MPWPGNAYLNQSRVLNGRIDLVVMLALWEDGHLKEIFGGMVVAELELDAADWLK